MHGGALFLVGRWPCFHCILSILMVERGLCVSSCKGALHSKTVPTSRASYLPKASSQMYSHSGFIYLLLYRKEKKRGKETSMCGCTCVTPTGDLAHNQGMCSDWESNQRRFGSQAHAQSTELHQPGQLQSLNDSH